MEIPYSTNYAGLYQRVAQQRAKPPFDLPPRWEARRGKLNLKTELNFVCTADIIGGNSGSPVLNRKGELLGVIFDGNIHSLTAGLIYTSEQNRAVAVHSEGIIEALRKVYVAEPLVDELLTGSFARKAQLRPETRDPKG